jgi:glutamate racemase
VAACLAPILDGGADTVVLGCTHFPFLVPLIVELAGPGVKVVDPAPAVARQVRRVASATGGSARLTLATSGDPETFRRVAHELARIQALEPVLACSLNDS